ncbi:MAG: hypothetical protein K6C09_08435 [Oscillospiraceae bacterium]|nr:hypothetical protein [Oscillospiraceae bacterium]
MNVIASKGNDEIRKTIGGWKTVRQLDTDTAAGQMCMSPATLARRKKHPETMTIGEFRALITLANSDEEEIVRMITGVKKR